MKKIITLIGLIGLAFIFSSCNSTIENPDEQYCQSTSVDGIYKCTKQLFSLDTTISITLYYDENSDYDINLVYQDIEAILIEYDQLLDPYDAYDGINNLYTINHSTSPVEISQHLYDAIDYALTYQDVDPHSDELLFNIALGPVLDIWHHARYSDDCTTGILYDRCPVPSETTLSQTFNTDPQDVILDEDSLTISFQKENMMLDLGGFAKGYISMIIEEYLTQYNINYILNLGQSNVLVGGKNTSNMNGDYYTIGLSKPEYDTFVSEYYGAVQISDTYSVVSSGSYQRYFKSIDTTDETIYHHIIDPRTNQPGGNAMAVTIITNQTGISDILSTAIFLMDYDHGLAYVNHIEGLEAIWYFSEDDIRMSDNFMDYFQFID